MNLKLSKKPFTFDLTREIKTSKKVLFKKEGFLIHIEDELGNHGWGEIAPINSSELVDCASILDQLGDYSSLQSLEKTIHFCPNSLAFGIGAALGELNGLVGNKGQEQWLQAPKSAVLLPKYPFLLNAVESLIKTYKQDNHPITVKWKVAVESEANEKQLLYEILSRLPATARLRIDANEGWDRQQANSWAILLQGESRLQWIEQPLVANDLEGLLALSKKVPIALDESLIEDPSLRNSWQGWQIRRPLLEGDPRILLQELQEKKKYRVVSTGFETGIGRRWIHHLAAKQEQGTTPAAPGLAPGWCPEGPLFSDDPTLVWDAA